MRYWIMVTFALAAVSLPGPASADEAAPPEVLCTFRAPTTGELAVGWRVSFEVVRPASATAPEDLYIVVDADDYPDGAPHGSEQSFTLDVGVLQREVEYRAWITGIDAQGREGEPSDPVRVYFPLPDPE